MGVKGWFFYSDNCGGQNKNTSFVSLLWYALQKFNFTSVEHKFLEKGHTQNENDSIHAAIENASRNISVYTTPQWAAIVSAARPQKPYIVKEMDINDFYNFKEVSKQLKNLDLDVNREKVYWSMIRTMKITAQNPNILQFQYEYEGPIYEINLVQRLRRSHEIPPNPRNIILQQLKDQRPLISKEKYDDLVSLCQKNIIPSVHHHFFLSLPYALNTITTNVRYCHHSLSTTY